MMTELTLKFYWPKYLVKYLSINYGTELRIDDHRYAFRLLLGTQKPNLSNSPKVKPDLSSQALYALEVPQYYIKNESISYIKNVGSVHFINFIEGQFWEELKLHVDAQQELKQKLSEQISRRRSRFTGLSIKSSIADFLKKFNITDDDMTFEAVLKRYQRKNCKKKTSITKVAA